MISSINRNGTVRTHQSSYRLARRIAHHIASSLGDNSLSACFWVYRKDECESVDFVVKNIFTHNSCLITFRIGDPDYSNLQSVVMSDFTEIIHVIDIVCGEFGVEPKLKVSELQEEPFYKNNTVNKRLNIKKATNLHYLDERDRFLDNIDVSRNMFVTFYVGKGFNYFANDNKDATITIPAQQTKNFTMLLMDNPIGLDVITDGQSVSQDNEGNYFFSSLVGLDNENDKDVVELLLTTLPVDEYGYIHDKVKAWDAQEKITGISIDWYVPKH